MLMNPSCKACLLEKNLGKHPENTSPETLKLYRSHLRDIIENGDNLSAPEVLENIGALRREFFGPEQVMADIKQHFNTLMLSLEDELSANVKVSSDPLCCALQYAMCGNFIDFGAMNSVDEDKLRELLADAAGISIDASMLDSLRSEIKAAKNMVYFTDNCGEIVCDKLLIRAMKDINPGLNITVMVRMLPVLNDATMEDARQVGLGKLADSLLHNGSGVAGTVLSRLPEDSRNTLDEADFFIAKGQGNYESLAGCGLNMYYVFMCKCELFTHRFNVPLYSGILTKEL